jgi:hypothetical protein
VVVIRNNHLAADQHVITDRDGVRTSNVAPVADLNEASDYEPGAEALVTVAR